MLPRKASLLFDCLISFKSEEKSHTKIIYIESNNIKSERILDKIVFLATDIIVISDEIKISKQLSTINLLRIKLLKIQLLSFNF